MSESSLPPNNEPNQDPSVQPGDPYAHLFEATPEESSEAERSAQLPLQVGSLSVKKQVDYASTFYDDINANHGPLGPLPTPVSKPSKKQEADYDAIMLEGVPQDYVYVPPVALGERTRKLFAPGAAAEPEPNKSTLETPNLYTETATEAELSEYQSPAGRAAQGAKRRAGRWDVSLRSEAEAHGKLRSALDANPQVEEIVRKYQTDHSNMDINDVPEAIRTDTGLRTDLAEYFLGKVAIPTSIMSSVAPRVLENIFRKQPNMDGYGDDRLMTSQEYAVLLALAKIDGTFKSELEINDEVVQVDLAKERPDENRQNQGQHRLAADILLEEAYTKQDNGMPISARYYAPS